MKHRIGVTVKNGHGWEEIWDDVEVDFNEAAQEIVDEHEDILIIWDKTDRKTLYEYE